MLDCLYENVLGTEYPLCVRNCILRRVQRLFTYSYKQLEPRLVANTS